SRGSHIQLWSCHNWDTVGIINEPEGLKLFDSGLAFHPGDPILATFGTERQAIRLWGINTDQFFHLTSTYRTSKVVLVGDAGEAGSGLAAALTAEGPQPEDPPLSRRAWIWDRNEVPLDDGRTEVRVTMLWDLTGQPGDDLLKQLSLDDVDVALIVFDPAREP